jgi:hypothetical protein
MLLDRRNETIPFRLKYCSCPGLTDVLGHVGRSVNEEGGATAPGRPVRISIARLIFIAFLGQRRPEGLPPFEPCGEGGQGGADVLRTH